MGVLSRGSGVEASSASSPKLWVYYTELTTILTLSVCGIEQIILSFLVRGTSRVLYGKHSVC